MAKIGRPKNSEKAGQRAMRKEVKRLTVPRYDLPKDITVEDVRKVKSELIKEAEAKWRDDNKSERDPISLKWSTGHLKVTPRRDMVQKKYKNCKGVMEVRDVAAKDPEAWHYMASYIVYYDDPTVNATIEERKYKSVRKLASEEVLDMKATKSKYRELYKLRAAFNDYDLDEATIEIKYNEGSQSLIITGMVKAQTIEFCNTSVEVWEAYDDEGNYYATMHIDPNIREQAIKDYMKPYGLTYTLCADLMGSLLEMQYEAKEYTAEINRQKAALENIKKNVSTVSDMIEKNHEETRIMAEKRENTKGKRDKKAKELRETLKAEIRELREEEKKLQEKVIELKCDQMQQKSAVALLVSKRQKVRDIARGKVQMLLIHDTFDRIDSLVKICDMDNDEELRFREAVYHKDYKTCHEGLVRHCEDIQSFGQHKAYFQKQADQLGEAKAYEAARQRCRALKPMTPAPGIRYKYIMTLDNIKQTEYDE